MKTSETIEAQEERKSAKDNRRVDPHSSPANTRPAREKLKQRDATRIAAWKWQPGQSGNPTGRPKYDLACEMAKAIFEQNGPALYRAYLKAALKGNGYIFQTLSDRAYGKLKERVEHEVRPYSELTDEQIRERIRELQTKLGIPSSEPEALPPVTDPKPN